VGWTAARSGSTLMMPIINAVLKVHRGDALGWAARRRRVNGQDCRVSMSHDAVSYEHEWRAPDYEHAGSVGPRGGSPRHGTCRLWSARLSAPPVRPCVCRRVASEGVGGLERRYGARYRARLCARPSCHRRRLWYSCNRLRFYHRCSVSAPVPVMQPELLFFFLHKLEKKHTHTTPL
jgi:hypothetical protein